MNAGEYVGKDGRTYRWVSPQNDGKYRPVLTTTIGYECGMVYLGAEDWPAAKAALDALIEQEAGEWVELETMDDAAVTHRFRIQLDGTNPQYWAGNRWWGEHNSMPWILAYRKGHEVALEESAEAYNQVCAVGAEARTKYLALRDAARELVEAIASTPTYCHQYTFWSVKGERWERIQSLAKALEGKL